MILENEVVILSTDNGPKPFLINDNKKLTQIPGFDDINVIGINEYYGKYFLDNQGILYKLSDNKVEIICSDYHITEFAFLSNDYKDYIVFLLLDGHLVLFSENNSESKFIDEIPKINNIFGSITNNRIFATVSNSSVIYEIEYYGTKIKTREIHLEGEPIEFVTYHKNNVKCFTYLTKNNNIYYYGNNYRNLLHINVLFLTSCYMVHIIVYENGDVKICSTDGKKILFNFVKDLKVPISSVKLVKIIGMQLFFITTDNKLYSVSLSKPPKLTEYLREDGEETVVFQPFEKQIKSVKK